MNSITRYQRPENRVRTVRFSVYTNGPKFTLHLWDTHQRDEYGKFVLAYQLLMHESGKTTVIFEGADYCCASGFTVDSNVAVEGIMGFLTLRPGDTDDEYFENYTQIQKDFCENYAEDLACEVQARFCDENGRVK